MKASTCIQMMFAKPPFLHRIRAAAEVGYDAGESWTARSRICPLSRSLLHKPLSTRG